MADVLVTHPYHLDLDPHEAAQHKPYPPLSPLVTAALLRRQGWNVSFDDRTFAASEATFRPERGAHDVVAILGDDHAVPMKMCLARIREAHLAMIGSARRAGAKVIVAGPDVSDHPQLYLDAGADAAVVGDATRVVAAWIAGETAVEGVHGARGAQGRAPAPAPLDDIPDPAWDLVDLGLYARRWRTHHGVWEMPVWTARGCPYRCNWCAKPTWGRSYASRSPERVADELASLVRRHAPDRVWFVDDIFALKRAWLRRFREVLSSPVRFRCLSRVDLLRHEDVVADLAAVGCEEVWVGAESGSDTILQAMQKDADVADVRTAVAHLRKHGIRVGFFLQLGYPGEDLAAVESTIALVEECRPDAIGVSVTYPLPGTELHARVAATMEATHWRTSMDNVPLFEAPFEARFYAVAKEVIRSTHARSRRAEALRAFLAEPDARAARRLAGAAWHSIRLPLVRHTMRRSAVRNPQAVPLAW